MLIRPSNKLFVKFHYPLRAHAPTAPATVGDARMDPNGKAGQVVGNIVTEWTQVLGLVVMTKYTREIGSKESVTSHNGGQGAGMGDKGGKKDKEKRKQQQVTKEKLEAQRKQDKARPRTP